MARSSRDAAKNAARALAEKRGWTISKRRVGWHLRDASYERAIAEFFEKPGTTRMVGTLRNK